MKFQYIALTFFGFMGVVAVILFANAPKKNADPSLAGAHGDVVIWGTFPIGGIGELFQKMNTKYQDSFILKYEFHDPKNFDQDIVEAIASGRGPDVLLLPDDLILRHSDKIEMISYLTIPQLAFQSSFVQASEIYMRGNGLVAVPYAIDPIIMYWNRDLFNNASISQPPAYWDDFLTIAPKLTIKNQKTQNITQSAIAFGEYVNVDHAKDILAMLFLQTGDPIVKMTNQFPEVSLSKNSGDGVVPDQNIISAIRFFMDFSNPLKPIYSWNRALPSSRDQFLQGSLAVYFDYASAYNDIKQKNPHLNFAVSRVPQARGTKVNITSAKLYGLSVLKTSRNQQTAFIAVQQLLLGEYAGQFASAYNLPPVRRDLLSLGQTDAVQAVLYDSAISARTWLDPRPELSNTAFQESIESVSSGRSDPSAAVSSLISNLSAALRPYQYSN